MIKRKIKNRNGQAFIVVLLAALVMGFLSSGWMLKSSKMSSTRRATLLRNKISDFKFGLIRAVDCAQSVASINAATQCHTTPAGGNGLAVTLKSATGEDLFPSGTRGTFQVQAFCKEKVSSTGVGLGTYYVGASIQVLNSAGAVQNDPRLNRPLNFSHPSTQIFTAEDSVCSTVLNGGIVNNGGTPSVQVQLFSRVTAPFIRGTTAPVQPTTNNGHTGNGTGNGSGDCFLGGLHGNDWTMPATTRPDWFNQELQDGGWGGSRTRVVYGYRWRSNPRCPAGYKAVSGGANCKAFGGYSYLQNGILMGARPDDDGNGWIIQCCGNQNGIAAGGAHPTQTGWVACILETGPP